MHLTEDHLRSLTTYLYTLAYDLEKKYETSTPSDPTHGMRKLARQIEVLSYNPILFESILEEYDINAGPLDEPLEQMPLHINEEDPVALAVVKWRLENAV